MSRHYAAAQPQERYFKVSSKQRQPSVISPIRFIPIRYTLNAMPSSVRERSSSSVSRELAATATWGDTDKRLLDSAGRGWRNFDFVYAIPLAGLLLGLIYPSRHIARGSASSIQDRLVVAEALGLLSALLLAIIGASYVSLDAGELNKVALKFMIGPYGCISKSEPGTKQVNVDLSRDLVAIGMAAMCVSVLALFISILAIVSASSVASNRSRLERKRWWKWAWLLFSGAMVCLIIATALSAWFYLYFYLLK